VKAGVLGEYPADRRARRRAGYTLALLSLVMGVSYADRMVLAVLRSGANFGRPRAWRTSTLA